jgi:hypothetical protein
MTVTAEISKSKVYFHAARLNPSTIMDSRAADLGRKTAPLY